MAAPKFFFMAGNENPAPGAAGHGGRVFFEAVLHPHRSLSPRGFLWVMAALGVPLAVLGIVFMSIGAWPVMGFCGLEFVLLYAAFRINFRDGRACERLRLSDSALEVSRIDGRGRNGGVWHLQPNWLRVSIDEPPQHDSQLVLSTHGRNVVVGAFLTPEERLDLAQALRRAIDVWRNAPPPCAAATP